MQTASIIPKSKTSDIHHVELKYPETVQPDINNVNQHDGSAIRKNSNWNMVYCLISTLQNQRLPQTTK